MKHALQLSATFATAAARDATRQVIENFLPGKATWGTVAVMSATDRAGNPELSMLVRFDTLADADALRGLLGTELPARPWRAGLLRQHECRHDEGSGQPCTPLHEVVK